MRKTLVTKPLPLAWLALVGALAVLSPASASAQAPSDGPAVVVAAEADPVAGLASEDAVVRVDAVRQLGATATPEACATLVQVLRADPVEEVRGWAARSLAGIGTAEAMAAVAEAADRDPSPRVRTLAASLVARSGGGAGSASVGVSVTASVAAPAPVVAAPAPVVVAPPVQPAPRQSRRNLILTISGWSAFGLAYVASVVVGGALVAEGATLGWSWFVPVVGPAIFGSNLIGLGASSGGLGYILGVFVGVLCWVPSLVQAAGVILGSIGAAGMARERREAAAATRGLQLAFSPVGPSDGPGLSVVGRF